MNRQLIHSLQQATGIPLILAQHRNAEHIAAAGPVATGPGPEILPAPETSAAHE